MSFPGLDNIIQALGWTLVHFVWQGAIVGLVFWLAMHMASAAGARFRYRLALGLFIAAGVMPMVTFAMVLETAKGAVAVLGITQAGAQAGMAPAAGGTEWLLSLERVLEPHLAWAVALWLAGVIVMSGRVCLDWWQVRRLTWVGVEPLPPEWDARVNDLVRAFGVSRPVRVLRSTVVRVPAVIGWLRPVVLIPAAALAGLSARQLELIIAHELAHIRRADYLVNLFQVFIETVLFYHPAVRWMSNRVRQERELCCDDAVIGTCGDTLTYAHALTELEVQRQAGFQTALAASGGQLSKRIYRMLDRPVPRRTTLIWSMSLFVGLAAGSMALAAQLALTGNATPGTEPPSRTANPAMAELRVPDQTAPEPSEIRQPTSDADRERTAETTASRAPDTVPRADGLTDSVAESGEPSGNTGTAAEAAPNDDNAKKVAQPESVDRNVASGDDASGESPEIAESASADATPDQAGDERQAPSSAEIPARQFPGRESSPALDALAGLQVQAPLQSRAAGREPPQPPRLARAARPGNKASRETRPEVRGGEPLELTAPQYPRRARLRGLQGSVAAAFTIDRDGRVRDIEVQKSEPAGVFDRVVREALAEWRFAPMTRDGEPVTRRVSKVFVVNLEDGAGATAASSDDECDPVTGTRICRP
jgi:TonB family protein